LYDRAWAIAESQAESEATFAALWGLCFCNFMSGRTREAREQSSAMIARAERLGDPDLMLEALHASWSSAFLMGDLGPALETTERGAALYRPERHHAHVTRFGTGHDSGICALGHGAQARILAGDADTGAAWLRDLTALMDRLDHPFSRCIGLTHAALANDFLGDYDAAVAACDEAIAIAGPSAFRMPLALATTIRGNAMISRGEDELGRLALRAVLDDEAVAVPASSQPMHLARLALAEWRAGETERGEAYLARAEAIAAKLNGCVAEAEVHRARAAVLRARGASDHVVAERLAAAARSADRDGALLLRARVDADRQRLLGV
jgi:hypothetical protein